MNVQSWRKKGHDLIRNEFRLQGSSIERFKFAEFHGLAYYLSHWRPPQIHVSNISISRASMGLWVGADWGGEGLGRVMQTPLYVKV